MLQTIQERILKLKIQETALQVERLKLQAECKHDKSVGLYYCSDCGKSLNVCGSD